MNSRMRLPEWSPGTPAVLCVAGYHAIPVSTARRAGADRILLALGRRRETLACLREDPRAALCVLDRGAAFTASGRALVVSDELEGAPFVAAVELRVETVQDHLEGSRTEILEPVRWRWTESEAAEADETVHSALRALAARGDEGR